ncbi:MAG: hypothetical protein FJ291_00215 [Planctomycetes bacterium]|nr:hypothetical protein [Planctomycetota bacterium]
MRFIYRAAFLAILAFAAAPFLAMGDVVHMADGTTREGRVVESNEREVVLEVGQGGVALAVRLPRSQVVRIEEKPVGTTAVMADYVARLSAALKSKSADDWHALGLWCRTQRGFRDKAAEAFDRALALDPDHAPTRLVLGHVHLNGAWMTRQEALQAIAPDLEQNAKLRELEFQKQLEEAKAATLEAEARSKGMEAKLAELRKDIEDLRQRLTLPPLPPDYYRPRIIYRPYIIIPPHHHPRPPEKKDSPKEGGPPPSKSKDDGDAEKPAK